MEKIKVYFIHGFLGAPMDWEPVVEGLKNIKNLDCELINLFEAPWTPEVGLLEWGKMFCRHVQKDQSGKAIVVGYSLGARLCMAALTVQPDLFKKVVLVSGNPGFNDSYIDLNPNSEDRQARWIQDSVWADKFLKLPWDEVVNSWNAQAVFRGGKREPVRSEKDYDRDMIALALTQWSLSQQPNMRSEIEKNADKILWVVGEHDDRYRKIGMELKTQYNTLKVLIASDASHRVIFDNPKYITELVEALSRS